MRNSTNILATIALGAVLAIGAASASMARDNHGGGHMGGGFGGDHSGGATPFFMNRGGGYGGGRGFGGHHFGGFRGRHDSGGAFFGFGPFWSDQYWAYDDDGAAYCRRVHGRHGVRYYCS
jgi:hypothetical protein